MRAGHTLHIAVSQNIMGMALQDCLGLQWKMTMCLSPVPTAIRRGPIENRRLGLDGRKQAALTKRVPRHLDFVEEQVRASQHERYSKNHSGSKVDMVSVWEGAPIRYIDHVTTSRLHPQCAFDIFRFSFIGAMALYEPF